MLKRSSLAEYQAQKTKIAACGLNDGDTVLGVQCVEGDEEVFYITRLGMGIRFSSEQVSTTGRTSKGVIGIRLSKGDEVIAAYIVEEKKELLLFTDRGAGKRMRLDELPVQGRAGKGLRIFLFYKNQSNGSALIASLYGDARLEFTIMQKDGTLTLLKIKEVSLQEREGKGKALVMVIMDNEVECIYRNVTECDINALIDLTGTSDE